MASSCLYFSMTAAALGGRAEAPGDGLVGNDAQHSLEEPVVLRLAHLGRDNELASRAAMTRRAVRRAAKRTTGERRVKRPTQT
jgi:hypothetical protein